MDDATTQLSAQLLVDAQLASSVNTVDCTVQRRALGLKTRKGFDQSDEDPQTPQRIAGKIDRLSFRPSKLRSQSLDDFPTLQPTTIGAGGLAMLVGGTYISCETRPTSLYFCSQDLTVWLDQHTKSTIQECSGHSTSLQGIQYLSLS